MQIIFQPELRRGLEQLGTNKFSQFIGIDKSIEVKTKENIYRIVIAATELAKSRTGALIVVERDIKLNDIIDSGIFMDAEISPQLLVNIFTTKTPLHDGAVVIKDNKIAAASCILPLADDKDIARESFLFLYNFLNLFTFSFFSCSMSFIVIKYFTNIFFNVSSLTSAIKVPSLAIDILPVSSETTTATQSVSFEIPMAALCLVPNSLAISLSSANGRIQDAADCLSVMIFFMIANSQILDIIYMTIFL